MHKRAHGKLIETFIHSLLRLLNYLTLSGNKLILVHVERKVLIYGRMGKKGKTLTEKLRDLQRKGTHKHTET